MKKLLIATHNPGKLREFREMLSPKGIDVVSAAEFDLPEPVEDGETFTDNARIKAEAASQATGLPALADDSGLCVRALQNQPGIHSARWAGPEKDFNSAMQRIQDGLNGRDDRTAYFVTVLVLYDPAEGVRVFEGRCDGEIVWPPRGDGGFGYDPVFQPLGHTRTFAEMSKEEKNKLSHRSKALARFLEAL